MQSDRLSLVCRFDDLAGP